MLPNIWVQSGSCTAACSDFLWCTGQLVLSRALPYEPIDAFQIDVYEFAETGHGLGLAERVMP